MPVTVIIGAQWGDEGKGRYVDWFSADAQVVARYAGGDNAGHTVAVGDAVYKMHLIPSGVLREHVVSVMGNGMVINPLSLLDEINRLRDEGVTITPQNLLISSRAHLITPAHIELDRQKEEARGEDAIGTTLKGIGPAYLDKIGRAGLRAGQMNDVELFADALAQSMQQHHVFTDDQITSYVQQYVEAAAELRPYVADTTVYLNQRLKEGARVVCEGAQGTLLDVDHGSYPFVTSSSPTVGGALTGLGIGPRHLDHVIGVAKSFSTRVGSGPMPTELDGELAQKLRGTGDDFWDEYGTTTGRSRRCGWLDAVMLRYSAYVNGYTDLLLTKLDILSGFDELKIAIAYEIDGERHEFPPGTVADIERAEPVYETLPGWHEDITGARSLDDLPDTAVQYIKRVSELCDIPVSKVSVGPEREQLVEL
jgi:adenylosuccinate synthase